MVLCYDIYMFMYKFPGCLVCLLLVWFAEEAISGLLYIVYNLC